MSPSEARNQSASVSGGNPDDREIKSAFGENPQLGLLRGLPITSGLPPLQRPRTSGGPRLTLHDYEGSIILPMHGYGCTMRVTPLLVAVLLLASGGEATRAQRPAQAVDWKEMIPVVRPLLKNAFHGVEEHRSLGLVESVDITGDGIDEALFALGTGGAYTSALAVMRMEGGQPIVAQFKRQNGELGAIMFSHGASVMNALWTELLPLEQAVRMTYRKMNSDGATVRECIVEAYRWNPNSKTFNYDDRLSDGTGLDHCQAEAR